MTAVAQCKSVSMKSLNYNHVFYFHVVATEGSLARAAEKLGLAQATVSEQIRQLERTLDATLFERQPAGLKLTAAGRQAFAQTLVMFQAAERLAEEFEQEKDLPHTLRVGVSASASRGVATSFLAPLLQVPDCVTIIRTGHASELLRQLRAHELDLVLAEEATAGTGEASLTVKEIYRPQLVAVVAQESTLTDPARAWREMPLIQYLPESPLRWEVDAYARSNGIQVRAMAETDDAPLMLEAAIRGLCIAVVPKGVARDAIEQNRVRVLVDLPRSGVTLNALYRDGKAYVHAARAVELLVEFASGMAGAPSAGA